MQNQTAQAADVEIHPMSAVDPGAVIGAGTTIGPFTVIGPDVKIGRNCRIGPHVVIDGDTTIGDENQIYQFASVGAPPQDLKWSGEKTQLVIGDRNIIREYVTIQPGVEQFGGLTKIGSRNLFMACCHVAHDCFLGDGNWVTNSAAIAGHVVVGNGCIIGGLSGIHQFVRLGDVAFVAAGSMVSKDVPPFCMAQGDRAVIRRINEIGMQRNGYEKDGIRSARKLFRHIFMSDGVMKDNLASVPEELRADPTAQKMLEFIESSERGVAFGASVAAEG